jgi:hypothetical protein
MNMIGKTVECKKGINASIPVNEIIGDHEALKTSAEK